MNAKSLKEFRILGSRDCVFDQYLTIYTYSNKKPTRVINNSIRLEHKLVNLCPDQSIFESVLINKKLKTTLQIHTRVMRNIYSIPLVKNLL